MTVTGEELSQMSEIQLAEYSGYLSVRCESIERSIAPLSVALENAQAEAGKVWALLHVFTCARLETEDRAGRQLRIYEGDSNERNIANCDRQKRHVLECIQVVPGGDERVIRTHEFGSRLAHFWDLHGNEKFAAHSIRHIHPGDLAKLIAEKEPQ